MKKKMAKCPDVFVIKSVFLPVRLRESIDRYCSILHIAAQDFLSSELDLLSGYHMDEPDIVAHLTEVTEMCTYSLALEIMNKVFREDIGDDLPFSSENSWELNDVAARLEFDRCFQRDTNYNNCDLYNDLFTRVAIYAINLDYTRCRRAFRRYQNHFNSCKACDAALCGSLYQDTEEI